MVGRYLLSYVFALRSAPLTEGSIKYENENYKNSFQWVRLGVALQLAVREQTRVRLEISSRSNRSFSKRAEYEPTFLARLINEPNTSWGQLKYIHIYIT